MLKAYCIRHADKSSLEKRVIQVNKFIMGYQ